MSLRKPFGRRGILQERVDYRRLPEIPCPVCDSNAFAVIARRFDAGRLVRCLQCGHVYLNPTLTDGILSTIYQKYHVWDDQAALMRNVEEWFSDPKGPYQYALGVVEKGGGFLGRRVLEVGCGPGRFLFECHRRGAQVTGVDLSPGAVRLAKEYFHLGLVPTSFDQAVREHLLPMEAFDWIFAFEIIEHLRRPVEFLRALHPLLVRGGKLFISTPNFILFSLMGKTAPAVGQWVEHIQFFEPQTLADCLARSHLEPIEVTTVNPWSPGEREKQALVRRVPWVNFFWHGLRRIPLFYAFKDALFSRRDRKKGAADLRSWNGTCLVCLARRPW